MEGVPGKFSTPEDEIKFLREQIAQKERELLGRNIEMDAADIETVAKSEIKEYSSFTPKAVLSPEHELDGEDLASSVESVVTSSDPVDEILTLAAEKGIRNALTVLEKTNNAYVIDEVHRKLVESIKSGVEYASLKEGVPPWHVLNMTLYEVTFPAGEGEAKEERSLTELAGSMEQLLLGLRTMGSKKKGNHFAIEIAVANETEDIIFYVSVPDEFKTLFEKQLLSLFPHASLTEQAHDYNIYVDGGHTIVADMALRKDSAYPLKMADDFASDPLAVLLNVFSKIERIGCGAAAQFVVRHPAKDYIGKYNRIIKEIEKGTSVSEAISRSTISGEIFHSIGSVFKSAASTEEDEYEPKDIDTQTVEILRKKIEKQILEVNIRIAVSAQDLMTAERTISELESAFNQFDTTDGNQVRFIKHKGINLRQAQKAFSFRQFSSKTLLPLSLAETAAMVHFPNDGASETHQVKQNYSQTAPAPTAMPNEGTLLGVNRHRGVSKDIYVTEKDRMRHFYVIGQTGTGKSVFLKNLITQDIQSGAGVCMIDPHGTDIEDVLGAVPPEREKDVIYFDPSRTDRVIGLNMLEYDVNKPEQKTFVVNELFSIFQKLYGANPESMGPMFEQYFRNATMLVMEDPDSGNTLMDIGRVMADAQFRRQKLRAAKNPVVVQFWQEIAGKAGGEASLENIVPYIVSKIDPLTANDYIRPIIGQQTSSFNFRQLMDERKILLVNLSKGRLGELNANLIGMIMVGKILMAALSRVDDPTMSFPPFYLHIDEFQNISTPAIASILSEARKYKLGLTMAHQFIAQLQPEIKDAVFGNVGSLAAFRVGPEDSQFLEQQFNPPFSDNDLMNIPNWNACMKILANGVPTVPFSLATMPPAETNHQQVHNLIEQSYQRYGRLRQEVEHEINERYRKPIPKPVNPMPMN